MLTKNGSSIEKLVRFTVTSDTITLHLPRAFASKMPSFAEGVPAEISQFCQLEKRGHITIGKELIKVEQHMEHVLNALIAIHEIYNSAVNPKVRVSSKETTRREMLESMPDKLLKQYAEFCGVDTSDIILPDDREKLIEITVGNIK